MSNYNEADTRAKLIDPAIKKKGWHEDFIIREEMPGTIDVLNGKPKRRKFGRVDYILNIKEHENSKLIPIAILEAKKEKSSPGKALEQAKSRLDFFKVPYLFSSNGHKFVKYDVNTKITSEPTPINLFPTYEEILNNYKSKRKQAQKEEYFEASSVTYEKEKELRYYQEAAIRELFLQISQGKNKCLLSLATGTGKTKIATHFVKRLAESNLLKKVLFLCDRDELRTQALAQFKSFFGNDAASIKTNKPETNARILVTTYQMMLSGENKDSQDYSFFEKNYKENYFSHIIIDECHRSAWKKWYKIIERNPNAIKIGLTATPKQIEITEKSDESVQDLNILNDNLKYFGEPIYEYSLGQAIEDGYLPACQIISKDVFFEKKDEKSETLEKQDLSNKEISDFNTGEILSIEDTKENYKANSFEKDIALIDRVKLMCKDLFFELQKRDSLNEKTIVFCVRDNHSEFVTREINNLYAQYAKENSLNLIDNFAFNCTTESGGKDFLPDFKSSKNNYFIACTCDLLSTGVDIPSLRNIVFFRYLKSPILFHQMLGRGQRIDPVTNKLLFRTYDYTNATRLLGEEFKAKNNKESDSGSNSGNTRFIQVKGLNIEIKDNNNEILIGEGGNVKKINLDEYKILIKTFFKNRVENPDELKKIWVNPENRKNLVKDMFDNGLSLDAISNIDNNYEYDQYDIISNLTFDNLKKTRQHRYENYLKNNDNYLKTIDIRSANFLKEFANQFKIGGIEYLENENIFELDEIKKNGGLLSLNSLGSPSEVIERTKLEILK